MSKCTDYFAPYEILLVRATSANYAVSNHSVSNNICTQLDEVLTTINTSITNLLSEKDDDVVSYFSNNLSTEHGILSNIHEFLSGDYTTVEQAYKDLKSNLDELKKRNEALQKKWAKEPHLKHFEYMMSYSQETQSYQYNRTAWQQDHDEWEAKVKSLETDCENLVKRIEEYKTYLSKVNEWNPADGKVTGIPSPSKGLPPLEFKFEDGELPDNEQQPEGVIPTSSEDVEDPPRVIDGHLKLGEYDVEIDIDGKFKLPDGGSVELIDYDKEKGTFSKYNVSGNYMYNPEKNFECKSILVTDDGTVVFKDAYTNFWGDNFYDEIYIYPNGEQKVKGYFSPYGDDGGTKIDWITYFSDEKKTTKEEGIVRMKDGVITEEIESQTLYTIQVNNHDHTIGTVINSVEYYENGSGQVKSSCEYCNRDEKLNTTSNGYKEYYENGRIKQEYVSCISDSAANKEYEGLKQYRDDNQNSLECTYDGKRMDGNTTTYTNYKQYRDDDQNSLEYTCDERKYDSRMKGYTFVNKVDY